MTSDIKMDKRILMIGIGNSGRGDDALGWKFIDETEPLGFEVDYRYQLQIEDAALIKEYDLVIFVDASAQPLEGGFSFRPCEIKNTITFSSHRIDPCSILWLCQELYGTTPEAYVMAIEGKHWELQQGMSREAEKNLAKAIRYFNQWVAEVPAKAALHAG